jgi:protein dithiol oxidoreductase (disulfide-forming)
MFTRILLAGLLMALPVVQARAFDEGIEYARVPQPQPTETDDKIEVLEFFWYGCPHCWHLEPLLKQWKATMPANAQFRRSPAILGPSWEPLARAYFAAELMGKADELHDPLFEAAQVKKLRLVDADSISKFVATLGVDPAAFKDAYGSFFVDMQVRKAMELTKLFGVDGVPAIIVNGKYRTSAAQAGGNDQLLGVVAQLIQQESQAGTAGAEAAPAGKP